MENVVLIVHLILALCLVGVVLLQRSEGGGLGMGGGGGSVMSGRQAATALAKLTWLFAACFIATSIALTIFAARDAAGTSVLDGLTSESPADPAAPLAPGADLLPPVAGDAPAETTVPRAD
jgi:preprotein translocase subunit SecG